MGPRWSPPAAQARAPPSRCAYQRPPAVTHARSRRSARCAGPPGQPRAAPSRAPAETCGPSNGRDGPGMPAPVDRRPPQPHGLTCPSKACPSVLGLLSGEPCVRGLARYPSITPASMTRHETPWYRVRSEPTQNGPQHALTGVLRAVAPHGASDGTTAGSSTAAVPSSSSRLRTRRCWSSCRWWRCCGLRSR